MRIDVNNQAGISNKYVRFIKWKLYQMARKFDHLIYAEVYLKKEGHTVPVYHVHLRLAIPGDDIIIKKKSNHAGKLLNTLSKDAKQYLAKSKHAMTYGHK